ncbi:MAG: 50S ribosomal protein L16 [Candidatus Harrisonbacteria bacterium CG10_big_fil_rev_8_21_14_0_10_44_23]|uniref:Large ribosomal subunit protein uL16 n=1 Tax=Candidatus Harrisonbacteria bacterium CG10_big_fil_rev_8_21_14_0_10_44_23 TaxID=1974585 RepID=A0A2H0UQN9_9BACT|nr:MAG: 50S ribosomal protein L16 [Candidatus Harrisonbacteria bacterium CG10_big_fil_rev_8_21_14_0_10_44_23]
MLTPKKVKHRKWQKGRNRKRAVSLRGTQLHHGEFGIKAMTSAWINSRQIEAARRQMTNFLKREGRVWIRIFPDKPVTKHAAEATLGGGKGSVDHYVFPVKPGRIMFEIEGVGADLAKEALRRAGHKLPVKCRIVSKTDK